MRAAYLMMDTVWTHFALLALLVFPGFSKFCSEFQAGVYGAFTHMKEGILELIWGK